ncbi:GNAT family N-acetyltransferase [Serinicoccus kebangsaanensis]|uniref:GNAT family N-acetyltransferase n=1 Tax=Serinicoccus kebangsaanensis TaxID=2602069 RepID=UPI00124EBF61|nr:GNAT family N-acetyltransferase [Serinicoccus kebangsaanensis]
MSGWLPEDFEHPTRVALPGTDLHLRPISPADTGIDMVAVMGSQQRLFSIFGPAWGWPPADMTAEEDRADLQRHADEIERHESFNYAVLLADESALVGCVYLDPPEKVGADADISWWVADPWVGTDVEQALDAFVPAWVRQEWPFERPRFIGADLTWADWLALDDLD